MTFGQGPYCKNKKFFQNVPKKPNNKQWVWKYMIGVEKNLINMYKQLVSHSTMYLDGGENMFTAD